MKLKLTQKDILNKRFKANVKGYDADEVDKFLDLVLADYRFIETNVTSYENEFNSIKRENESLKSNVRELEQEISILKSKIAVLETNKTKTHEDLDPLELLQKCSKYEVKLAELGVDPNKIK